MAKCSSLVIGFFFVALVVLQSCYAESGAGAASSPDYGVCDPRRLVNIGNFSSCDKCHPACFRSSYSASTCANSTNIGPFVCKCCTPFHDSPSGTSATKTTSLLFLSFSLFLSLMLSSRLFI